MGWDSPPTYVSDRNLSPFATIGVEPVVLPVVKEVSQSAREKVLAHLNRDSKSTQVDAAKVNYVWEPIPNSSQAFAIDSRAQHTLYYGARGPGKTATQLFKFRARVGIGYGEFWRGVIFDRRFKDLGDLVAQSNRFFSKFNDGAKWLKSATDYKWVWPTGEELLFRHVKSLEDYDAFHGHEYPFIGWNELTKHPTLELYDKFMSINRSSFSPERDTPKRKDSSGKIFYNTYDGNPLPPIPLEVFSTTNPHGPGHMAVKKRFIDVAKPGQIVRHKVSFFDNLIQKEIVVERTQIAIFGSFYENPYLDATYRAGLIELCEKDPALKAAWIEGRWDVSSGGAIDDLWDRKVHVLKRFKVPSNWRVDRCFDWGSSAPFSTVWFCEANGEEIEFEDGTKFCPQAGSLIGFDEYYGTEIIGSNKGLKMSARDVAKNIANKERILKESGWVDCKIHPGPADNQIRNVIDSGLETIEDLMSNEGIRWTESDKSKGSRLIGLQLFRDRLLASKKQEKPGIYFTENCVAILDIIPNLPRDPDNPEDIDTESEDHLWDAIRYRILKGHNKFSTTIKTNWSY
jgi:hypothetical protein